MVDHPTAPRPTLADIAARCGLTKATVSKALHRQADRYPISAEVRRRVEAVAAELGYQPEWRRRAAASRRSHTVGLMFGGYSPHLRGVMEDFTDQLAETLDRRGYRLAYAPVAGDLDAWRSGRAHLGFDGLVLIDPLPAGIDGIRELGLPTVAVNQFTSAPITHFLADERLHGRLAVEHLAGLGHRSLLFVRRGRNAYHYSCAWRLEGIEQACAERGIALEVAMGPHEPAELIALARARAATAVIGWSHEDVLFLLAQLWRQGVRVPDGFSLLCFDDVKAVRLATPPITVVAVPIEELTRRAAEHLIEQIEGRIEPGGGQVVVPGRLIARESTAPPAPR
ncbi:MAG: LacI family transcriptional regulator [Planctomycetes bacterium]|nr:LacI family transcriptional regulator [Planctomycetota bacterium]